MGCLVGLEHHPVKVQDVNNRSIHIISPSVEAPIQGKADPRTPDGYID